MNDDLFQWAEATNGSFEDEVLPLFEEHRKEWLAEARDIAFRLGRQQDFVTIDDVRKFIRPPPGKDPRVMGAVFSQRTVWELVTRERSDRRTCHHRPISIWRLKNAYPF
jgi:hypothetical protein